MENRARLVLEVVDAVSQEWSAERIGIRVSPIGSFQNVDNGPNEEEDALYLISELANRGVAVIMVSSELPEILGMSDRVMVMHEGRITGILDKDEADQETILSLASH